MLEVGVLGPLQIIRDGRVIQVRGPKPRTLLAALAVNCGEAVSTDRLIDALWGERPPASAHGTLHTHLTHLRAALEPDRERKDPAAVIVTSPAGYTLHLGENALDAARFEALTADGRTAMTSGDHAAAAKTLHEALGIWRGRAYEGFDHEEFARAEAVRLEQLRVSALEDRIDADLRTGRHAELVGELESLVDTHPLLERLWGFLMVALYRSGRQADALRAYQRVRRVLGEELGVEPGRALQDLELRILQQDMDLDAPSRREPRTVEAREPEPTLPIPLTGFVGRREEMLSLAVQLKHNRLTTITGPGGVGKSRLAIEASKRLADSEERLVHYVDLSIVEQPDAVRRVVAGAVGAAEEMGRPLIDSIARSLAGRGSMLLLDGAEALVPETSELASELVSRDADIRILTTSRTPLGVVGETIMPLRPLGLPETGASDRALETDAVRLFTDRAAATDPGFVFDESSARVVADICRRVDGMPLAIELVTGRLRVLSLDDVMERLDDFFKPGASASGRPPTSVMPELLEWSYGSLSSEERSLIDRLAAFSGSFTLEMSEAMATDAVPAAILPDLMESMVQKSLIYAERGRRRIRYRMLDIFRRYVLARVDARGEGEMVFRRHADLLAGIAEDIERAFGSPDWLDLISTLDADHDLESEQSNFRRALNWSISAGDSSLASRLVGGLARYWRWRGRFEECREGIDAVLDMPSEPGTELSRAKVLREAAGLARQTGRWEEANHMAVEAAQLFSASGATTGVADCLYDLGWGALLVGDFTRAEQQFAESVELWRSVGNEGMASFPLVALAWVHKARGDLVRARTAWDEAIGDGHSLAARTGVTFWLADLEIDTGNLDKAEEIARESLKVATDLGFTGYASGARYVLARLAMLRDDLDGADALLEGAIEDARREASLEVIGFAMRLAVEVALEKGDIPEAERRLEEFASLVGDLGGPLGTIALAELRAGALESSHPTDAVSLLAGAAALRDREGLPLPEPDRKRYRARSNRLKAALEPEAHENAVRRGQEMSTDALDRIARRREQGRHIG